LALGYLKEAKMMDNNNVSSQEIMNFLYDQQRRGAGISEKTIEYYKKELEINDERQDKLGISGKTV
jgi:DNA-binding CsgD family transcriptional regulator